MARLTVADNDADLARRAAARLTELIDGAADAHGQALMSLTGGSTPRALYSTLADPQQPWRERIPWPRVHLFWGDERHVPPDHPDSNYGMAKATLIDHVPIPDAQIHRMHGEIPDAHEAAVDYERTLNSVMSGLSRSDDVTSAFPQSNGLASAFRRKSFFDVMLLGVGADAHIASLFPGSEFLDPDIGRPSTPNQPDVGRRVDCEPLVATAAFALGARERVFLFSLRMQEHREVLADGPESAPDHFLRRGAHHHVVPVLQRQPEQLIAHRAADYVGLHPYMSSCGIDSVSRSAAAIHSRIAGSSSMASW